jgi:hypothetical protein
VIKDCFDEELHVVSTSDVYRVSDGFISVTASTIEDELLHIRGMKSCLMIIFQAAATILLMASPLSVTVLMSLAIAALLKGKMIIMVF